MLHGKHRKWWARREIDWSQTGSQELYVSRVCPVHGKYDLNPRQLSSIKGSLQDSARRPSEPSQTRLTMVYVRERESFRRLELFYPWAKATEEFCGCTQGRPGERRSYARPISDSLFVSHCKTVQQIGIFQHVRH